MCNPYLYLLLGFQSSSGSVCLGHREQKWLWFRCLYHVYNGQRIRTQGRQERGTLERTLSPGKGRGGSVWSPATSLHYSKPLHPVHCSPRAGWVLFYFIRSFKFNFDFSVNKCVFFILLAWQGGQPPDSIQSKGNLQRSMGRPHHWRTTGLSHRSVPTPQLCFHLEINKTICSVPLCRIQSANTEGGKGGSCLSGGLHGARSETQQLGVLPGLGHAQNNIWLRREGALQVPKTWCHVALTKVET